MSRREDTFLAKKYALVIDGMPGELVVVECGSLSKDDIYQFSAALSRIPTRQDTDLKEQPDKKLMDMLEDAWDSSAKTPDDLKAYIDGMTELYKSTGSNCPYWT